MPVDNDNKPGWIGTAFDGLVFEKTTHKAPGLLSLIGEAIQDDVDDWAFDGDTIVVHWKGKRLVVRVEAAE